MSTPGLLLFLLGCKHGILSCSWNADIVEWRKPNTGRVKLKKSTGAFCPQLSFGGNGKNPEAIYCPCCYVNSEKGDGGDKKKTRRQTAPCQLQGLQSRHSKGLSSWRHLPQDKQEFRSDTHPQHFWNWMKAPYLNM